MQKEVKTEQVLVGVVVNSEFYTGEIIVGEKINDVEVISLEAKKHTDTEVLFHAYDEDGNHFYTINFSKPAAIEFLYKTIAVDGPPEQ